MNQRQNAIIYGRLAMVEDDDQRLEAQRRRCRQKASRLGLRVVGEHLDVGYSAATLDRPGLRSLLGRIEEGDVDYVVVDELTRLSRDLHDWRTLWQSFDQAGVTLASVLESDRDIKLFGARLTEGLGHLSEEAKAG
jgi:site-specific DNA recombinase